MNVILESTLQNFEAQFSDVPRFAPNLLRFHTTGNIYNGVYDDDILVGTFVLQPYCNMQDYKTSMLSSSTVLRIERPLVKLGLGDRKRSEVLKEIKDHALKFAKLHLYDFIEMELYDRIDEEVFFPSSLSTIGSFNLPRDYRYLEDNSFEEIKKTICFELLSDREPLHASKGKHRVISWFDRLSSKWSFAEHNPAMIHRQLYVYDTKVISSRKFIVASLNPSSSLLPHAFNLPEYFLVRKGLKPEVIQWYPDMFLLSRDNWSPLIGSMEEVRRRVIDRGKIYRISGLSTEDLLTDIEKIWTKGPLSHLSRLQIFSDTRYYDAIREAEGRIVHTLRLLRKNMH